MQLPTCFRLNVLPLLCILFATNLSAQSFSWLSVDATNFPDLVGDVVLSDKNGQFLTQLGPNDIVIYEDGNPVQATISINCPAPVNPIPLSVAFVIDRSGSMTAPLPNGQTPLELTKNGVSTFLNVLQFTPSTAVAITGFNEQAFLVSDFRTSAPPLVAAMATMEPDGATLFDPAFLDPLAGGVQLLSTRSSSVKRVLIFITDGSPNDQPSTSAIIAEALAEGVEVHTITIGARTTGDLVRIAQETGGRAYENIADQDKLSAILGNLALPTRGISPCRIQWRSNTGCLNDTPNRRVQLEVPAKNIITFTEYTVPSEKQVYLHTSEKFLWFGTIAFPGVSTQDVEITPLNSSITVTGTFIDDSTHFKVLNWGGSAPPFTLNEGEKRKITVQFAPTDTSGYGAELFFLGTPCRSPGVLLAGGQRTPGGERAPLVLEAPLGGEAFDGCDSVTIRWGGVPPEQPIRIRYSNNDGATWQPITDSARGYRYQWFPPEPGDNYRIQVSTDADEQHIAYTIAGGGDSLADDIFASQATLLNPWGLGVWNDTLYIAESGGRNRVRTLDLLSLIISSAAGTGAPGNGGDGGPAIRARFNGPSDVVVTEDKLYIADRNNFKIRVVDRATNIITTFAGTGAVGFTEDGVDVRNQNLGAINGLALDENYLYISELGSVTDPQNDRVRRIHLQTGVITTLAGGGTSFDSDGVSGLRARILTPQGLAIRDGVLYFAERDGARVRTLNLASGIISTAAGTGTPGYGGDGGAATLALISSPTDVLFVKDNMYITEATNGNRIRAVDMNSTIISTFAGTGRRGFSGDSGAARNAEFDEPNSITLWGDLLLISDRFNRRIRAITLYRADGLDASDSSFTFTSPQIRVNPTIPNRTVNLGESSIGVRKDSVITALVCNSGQGLLVLDSAQLIGLHPNDFRIAGGLSNVPILPGECRTITIELIPQAAGLREAQAVFYGSCTRPDTLSLSGIGLPECGVANVRLVNFGLLQHNGQAKDSTIVSSFCNNGNTTISGNVTLASGTGTFTIIEGEGPFTLAPNECLELKIRFTPSETGRSTGLVEYSIPSECGKPQTVLFGQTVRPQEVEAQGLTLSSALCPDETRNSVVTIRNAGELPLEITDLTLATNNEGFTILSPIPTVANPLIILPNNQEGITVQFAPTSAGPKAATLRITSNDPRGEIDVPIEGRRDSLRLVATESQIIAARAPGAVYPRDTVLTVQNTGDVPITVTGAQVSGNDPTFFAVSAAQFPIVVAPNTTEELTIQLLQPTEERSYRAQVNLTFQPTCNLSPIAVDITHAGTRPVLSVEKLTFPTLLCDESSRQDTTIVLSNPGGDFLQISAVEVVNDPEGNFVITDNTPITIPPGESRTLTISFVPQSFGTKTIRLRFTTNTEQGTEEIELIGRREQVAFQVSETTLVFDPAAPAPNTATVTLRNTGSVALTWNLFPVNGPWTVLSVVPETAPVGGESTVTLRYDGPPEGVADGFVDIAEPLCGNTEQITLQTSDGAGMLEVWLPHDSALFNTTVRVPLRYRLTEGVSPTLNDTFETKIRFKGATFFFESLTSGEVIARDWNPITGELTLTIRGSFGDRQGDTLTTLVATALFSAENFTPLTFEQFVWGRSSLQTTFTDGSFRVLGLCFDPGLHLTAREPSVERIRPNPASHQAVAEIHLPDWAWIRGRLIDAEGKEIEVLHEQYLQAGHHELSINTSLLPKGMYVLRLETPHGTAEASLMVVR